MFRIVNIVYNLLGNIEYSKRGQEFTSRPSRKHKFMLTSCCVHVTNIWLAWSFVEHISCRFTHKQRYNWTSKWTQPTHLCNTKVWHTVVRRCNARRPWLSKLTKHDHMLRIVHNCMHIYRAILLHNLESNSYDIFKRLEGIASFPWHTMPVSTVRRRCNNNVCTI